MNKVKLFLLLALSATLSFGAMAQAGGEKAPLSIGTNGELQEVISSDIQFTEETFDFGELDEGPLVTHEFKLKNIGKEALVLSQVKASCGCTTPDWSKDPIAPGAESVIKVTYNMGNSDISIQYQGWRDKDPGKYHNPTNTVMLVDALQKAGKDFDLRLYPGADHVSAFGKPWQNWDLVRARWDFISRYL